MSDRSEIAFFDLETTYPTRSGPGYAILEFGAILVCPKKLVELQSYSTLVRPYDPSFISNLSVRSNGISRDAVISSPTFGEISDKVYDLLHGRIWAGHNIVRFDCARIREAFAEIGKAAPEPKATIDSLDLLTRTFGKRAGDMKMASLANYFGLGKQSHRSLEDARLNLEILKYCGGVLLLESSLPNIFTDDVPEGDTDFVSFLDHDGVYIPYIRATFVPLNRNYEKIKIFYKDVILQLCSHLKVRFEITPQFADYAGRPKLYIVVDASTSLCRVLDACDDHAKRLSIESGSSSEWMPVVKRKKGYLNSPTVRLNIPIVVTGEVEMYGTEIYHKDSSSAMQKYVFSRIDAAELKALFIPGTLIDACFSMDTYDYQQNAGIRLVAKKLAIHSTL